MTITDLTETSNQTITKNILTEVSWSEVSWSYDFDHQRAKYMHLIDWVKGSITAQPGSFVTAKELFNQYKLDTTETAQVTEDLFYKEIQPLMFGLNIKPGRFKGRQGRGYQGISFTPYNRSFK